MGKPARRPAGFAIRRKGVCFYWGITNPPLLIGRTFFYGGLQIRRDAWRVYALGTNPPRIGQNP